MTCKDLKEREREMEHSGGGYSTGIYTDSLRFNRSKKIHQCHRSSALCLAHCNVSSVEFHHCGLPQHLKFLEHPILGELLAQ